MGQFPSPGRRCPYPESLGTCILHSSEDVLDRTTLNQGHGLTWLDPLGSSPAPSPAPHQHHLLCNSWGWRREALSGSTESVVSWESRSMGREESSVRLPILGSYSLGLLFFFLIVFHESVNLSNLPTHHQSRTVNEYVSFIPSTSQALGARPYDEG